MPIGRLTRKIQCQLKAPVSRPPSSTPMLPPPAHTKPYTPIALARSAGCWNRFMISDSATADTTAPPRPCTARAAISQAWVCASPQASEATREQRDAEQEQLAVAVQVAEPAAEQQEAAEGEHVGVDHPDQRGLGELQVRADRRQRHVHDRGVEHDHQHAQAQHHQCQPAFARVGRVGHRGIFRVVHATRRTSRVSIDIAARQVVSAPRRMLSPSFR